MSSPQEGYIVLARENEVSLAQRNSNIVTGFMLDLANAATLANSVGIDLAAKSLKAEALFHFQLAVEKVNEIRSYGLSYDTASMLGRSNKSPQGSEESRSIDYAHVRDLKELGTIDPPRNKTSGADFMIWMKCMSLVALRNSALILLRQDGLDSSKELNNILDTTTNMLTELEEPGAFRDSFYKGRPQNVVLGMSLRILQGERLLQTAQFLAAFSERRRKLKVHEGMKEFAHAVDLGRAFLEKTAKENSFIAQVLSKLGFCLLMEGEESLASIVYECASIEYSQYRLEGDIRGARNVSEEDQGIDAVNNPFIVLGAPVA